MNFEFEKIFHLPRPKSNNQLPWFVEMPIAEHILTIAQVRDHLRSNLVPVGGHRKDNWNDQWAGKLAEFKITRDPLNLLPDYLKVNRTMRYDGQYVLRDSPLVEYRAAQLFRTSSWPALMWR